MFSALKYVNSRRKKQNNIIESGKGFINNTTSKIEYITEHFKSCFSSKNPAFLAEIVPSGNKDFFTIEEISKAIKSLKNNRTPGIDNINNELIKYGPKILHEYIKDTLNQIIETGIYPEEIKTGILNPLQKPGKPKGPVQNLRPVILLSVLRKILAVCTINRLDSKLRSIIPISQCAYSKGRSTTELIFTFKVLCEKAIISENYRINLLMLDMSKAFDTIERGTLIDDLKYTLENDELFLIYLLLKDVKLIVKLNNEFGKEFITNIGSPQGDSASAIFFILYLAISLTILIKNSSLQLDHTYSRKIDEHIIIDQQYADDIGWASTNNEKIEEIENTVPQILKNRNLLVNESKTEKYTVERNGSDQWKACKYVGSLLDTQQDIKRRKSLANQSYISVKDIYRNKDISLDTKLRIHNALIESIFLYNCEV